MLVIFLILFTKVLADDSDEDKYLDLLPEEEKQQFLENVARRILKDVGSKANVTSGRSGEVSEDELNQHSEYVNSIIKEEQQSIKNKGDGNDKRSNSASEEKEILGVQPLDTEKTASQAERGSDEDTYNNNTVEDVTGNGPIIKISIDNDHASSETVQSHETSETQQKVSQKTSKETNDIEAEEKEVLGVQPLDTEKTASEAERVYDEGTSNNNAVEDATDNTPIIKRPIDDDNDSKTVQSHEASETLQKVSQKSSKETNDLEAENEKFISANNASDAKVSFEKDLEAIESTTAVDDVDKAASVQGNETDDAQNVSVKSIYESRRINNQDGKFAENTTDIDTKTSTVKIINSSNNVSGTEGEVTSHPSEAESSKSTLFESTMELGEANDSESLLKSKSDVSKKVENEDVTKTTISNRDSFNEEPTESVTDATQSDTKTTESVTDATESDTKTTESVADATESFADGTESDTKTVTDAAESATGPTKSVADSPESVTDATEYVTETTKPVTETTVSVIETIELVPETRIESEIVTTEAPTDSTSALFTSQSIPVATTEKRNIIVEDFTSAPAPATAVQSTILEPQTTTENNKMVINKRVVSSEEVTLAAIDSGENADEDSVEATTKKHKVIVHKPVKYIVGPRGKKMAKAKKHDAQNANFIELEKVYYNQNKNNHKVPVKKENDHKVPVKKENDHKVPVKKEYHVYEIPADQPPFTKDESPVANQPYYVPVYNYAPNHAYFNPQNRLGPNAEDSSAQTNAIFNDDDDNNYDKTETLKVKMEYDRIYDNSKNFDSNHKIHSMPKEFRQNTEQPKSSGKINLADYIDSDYYFERENKGIARKSYSTLPDSYEADHPTHSIREGGLKNHLRAVRNILFQQKSFGLVDRNNHGASVEKALRKDRKRKVDKKLIRTGEGRDFKHKNNNKSKKRQDYNGYKHKRNDKKGFYLIDDFFKANIEKFSKKSARFKVTPHPYIENKSDKAKAFSRHGKGIQRAVKRIKNKIKVKQFIDLPVINETLKAKPDQDDIRNEGSVKDNVKLNLKSNEINVYMQVLKDMVALDNKALVRFDWLGTAVDIQAALQKIFELTALVENEEYIHPSDEEILKYILFIHKLASETHKAKELEVLLRKKMALPSKKKKKKNSRMPKRKGLINRVWLYLRNKDPEIYGREAIKQLNSFFMGIEDVLYDLHDAIKNIAKVTTYKNQHWYQNLKELYIKPDEQDLLQLLLHMSAMRLFTLIEESAENGLEEDYIKYVKKNRQHSKKTLQEMMFVMKILDEYKKYVE